MKKMVSFIVCAVMLACSFFTNAIAASSSNYLGDANGDGKVTMKDVLTVRKYIAGFQVNDIDKALADANQDNGITTKDVLLIRQHLVGLIQLGKLATTISLLDTEPLGTKWNIANGTITDLRGVSYEGPAAALYGVSHNEYEVYLGGKYSTFSGNAIIAQLPWNSNYDEFYAYMNIYADGELVYTSSKMTAKTDAITFNVDIQDVEYLKFHFYTNKDGGSVTAYRAMFYLFSSYFKR